MLFKVFQIAIDAKNALSVSFGCSGPVPAVGDD